MRTKNSINNSITALLQSIIVMLIGFISQSIFIKLLGTEYLGLNGLFTNILSMLSIFELGIGNAIVYNLYKPIAHNKTNEIKQIMNFYKKAYNIIAIIILLFGLILIPFLPFFVSKVNVNVNINAIYLLFLFSTITSYILSYKRSLIYANQKSYIINLIHTIYVIVLNASQLLILYYSRNYYIYLSIKIMFQLLENIFISLIADKLYPYLKEKSNETLDKKIEKQIFVKVKALFFHKVATILVLSTDNIIISKFFGVVTVGYYSNYYMIINSVNTLAAQVINSSVASIGNLLIENNKEKTFAVFKKIRFLNFWISCVTGVCIFTIIQPFIIFWLGKKFLLPISVTIVLTLNYYQKLMRRTYAAFKDASGTWEEDKYIPFIESILNIGLSILFLKIFGLAGVFLGTIASGLVLWCYSYPRFVYKKLFGRSYLNYALETIGYIIVFIIIATTIFFCQKNFYFNNNLYKVIFNTILALIFSNIMIITIFIKNNSLKYYIKLIKTFIKVLKTKLKKERKL